MFGGGCVTCLSCICRHTGLIQVEDRPADRGAGGGALTDSRVGGGAAPLRHTAYFSGANQGRKPLQSPRQQPAIRLFGSLVS